MTHDEIREWETDLDRFYMSSATWAWIDAMGIGATIFTGEAIPGTFTREGLRQALAATHVRF